MSNAPGHARLDLLDLGQGIVDRARPGEQVEAFVARSRGTSVKVHDGRVESFTRAESFGVGVRVIADRRQGFAHCGTFEPQAVQEALDEARENAGFAEPDEWGALPEPDGVAYPEIDGWSEAPGRFGEAAKVDLALALEREALARDPRVTSSKAASYGDSMGEVAVVSSTGIRCLERGASCSASVVVVGRDDSGATTGWGVDASRDPSTLDTRRVAADAVERAVRMLGAGQPASRRITIVLEPRLAASFLGIVGGMLSAERVAKGRTPFAERRGEQIASAWLTLTEDPTDTRSLGADVCDGEGLASRPTVLISNGVLQSFVTDTSTARRLTFPTTASALRGSASTPHPGVRLLVVAPGATSRSDLIGQVDDGLFVTALSGLHSGVNAISGDFSVGVEGLVIRGGELAEPVREATLASTVPRMLLGIGAVGSDLEWIPGGSGMVSVAIDDVALSGA